MVHQPLSNTPAHRIGEAARRCGVSAANIRYYESEGLLPRLARSEGDYRLYSEADIHRLRFIRLCRAMDMSLDEVRTLVALDLNNKADCATARAALIDLAAKRWSVDRSTLAAARKRSATSRRSMRHAPMRLPTWPPRSGRAAAACGARSRCPHKRCRTPMPAALRNGTPAVAGAYQHSGKRSRGAKFHKDSEAESESGNKKAGPGNCRGPLIMYSI